MSIAQVVLWCIIGILGLKCLLSMVLSYLEKRSYILKDSLDCKTALKRGLSNYAKDAMFISKNIKIVEVLIKTYGLKDVCYVINESSSTSQRLMKTLLKPLFWWSSQIKKYGKKKAFEKIVDEKTEKLFKLFHEFVLFVEETCEKMIEAGVIDKNIYYERQVDYE